MKVFRTLAALTALILALPASATPIDYQNAYNFANKSEFGGTGSTTWTHTLAPDFDASLDATITLLVNSRRAVDSNDILYLNGIQIGTLNEHNATANNTISSIFTLDLSTGWKAGDTLNLELRYNADTKKKLTMESSMLSIKYAAIPETPQGGPGTAAPTDVPEPGTVALFGLGLLALLVSRKKSRGAARA